MFYSKELTPITQGQLMTQAQPNNGAPWPFHCFTNKILRLNKWWKLKLSVEVKK